MGNKLYCGAAKINITPATHLLPWMFGLMDRHYCKVHDELYLRVLAFQSGEARALIVVYDLDKATNPEEWTKRIEEETGVPADNILYLAIHTHTAPLTGYRPFEGPNFIGRKAPEVQERVREYEAFLLERLLEAVKAALDGLAPAHLGYIEMSFDNRYWEDRIMGLLDMLSPFTVEGNFSFRGEDESLWRFHFTGADWKEGRGEIAYTDLDPSAGQGKSSYPVLIEDVGTFEALLSEVESRLRSDERPAPQRGRQLMDAFQNQDPDGVLLALTGWSLRSLGALAGIWRDTEGTVLS